MRDQLKHLLRGCRYNAMVNLNFFMILIRDNLMSVLRTQIKRLELRNLTVHGDDELETNSPRSSSSSVLYSYIEASVNGEIS